MSEEINAQTVEAQETERQELRRQLEKEAIEVGLKVGKRWSDEKLIEEIGRKHIEIAQQTAVTNAKREIKSASDTDIVRVRILPMGNDKISRGVHIPGKGDLFYKAGDTMNVERQIAEVQQARGLVEIQNAAA